jgi:hypothetical protein
VSGGLVGVHEVPDVVEFQGTVDDGRRPHVEGQGGFLLRIGFVYY